MKSSDFSLIPWVHTRSFKSRWQQGERKRALQCILLGSWGHRSRGFFCWGSILRLFTSLGGLFFFSGELLFWFVIPLETGGGGGNIRDFYGLKSKFGLFVWVLLNTRGG